MPSIRGQITSSQQDHWERGGEGTSGQTQEGGEEVPTQSRTRVREDSSNPQQEKEDEESTKDAYQLASTWHCWAEGFGPYADPHKKLTKRAPAEAPPRRKRVRRDYPVSDSKRPKSVCKNKTPKVAQKTKEMSNKQVQKAKQPAPQLNRRTRPLRSGCGSEPSFSQLQDYWNVPQSSEYYNLEIPTFTMKMSEFEAMPSQDSVASPQTDGTQTVEIAGESEEEEELPLQELVRQIRSEVTVNVVTIELPQPEATEDLATLFPTPAEELVTLSLSTPTEELTTPSSSTPAVELATLSLSTPTEELTTPSSSTPAVELATLSPSTPTVELETFSGNSTELQVETIPLKEPCAILSENHKKPQSLQVEEILTTQPDNPPTVLHKLPVKKTSAKRPKNPPPVQKNLPHEETAADNANNNVPDNAVKYQQGASQQQGIADNFSTLQVELEESKLKAQSVLICLGKVQLKLLNSEESLDSLRDGLKKSKANELRAMEKIKQLQMQLGKLKDVTSKEESLSKEVALLKSSIMDLKIRNNIRERVDKEKVTTLQKKVSELEEWKALKERKLRELAGELTADL